MSATVYPGQRPFSFADLPATLEAPSQPSGWIPCDDFDENDRPPWTFWVKWDANLRERGFAFDFEQVLDDESFPVLAPPWHAFARRLSDNESVLVKYTRKSKFPQEGHLVQRLIAEPLRSHPHNRTPYIAVIDLGPEAWLLLSPLCGSISGDPFPIPKLTRAEDFLDFFEQITQAIHFLHSNGIAHCDLYYANLLMQRPARRPYQWYLMDFGSAVFYDPTDPLAVRPLIDGKHRTARRDSPDYQRGGTFDPFAFDVHCWGHWITILCKEVKFDFPALQELAQEMTHLDPHMRPSLDVVLKRLTGDISDFRTLLSDGVRWDITHWPRDTWSAV
ncbi:kinase-like domain-containing protein [Mycena rosella]|uniref:Kinase-like domain-containing protein n=1 Tax=Mycena rosella TaxID=1033263 RepID=A0AAD7H167_MYCRO|nr:kinase-like domain-containing protein [Mycena rosella]